MSTYRTVFLSDLHLGSRWCKAKFLSRFLADLECENLYLVGDIIDGWKLQKRSSWPQSHNKVIRRLLKMSRKTRVIYVTGNHDQFMDEFDGFNFGNIKVQKNAFHVTADGRKFFVLHGDEFDLVVRYKKWVAVLGDKAYDLSLWLNAGLNTLRSALGLPYWSLSEYLKHKVKDAVNFISDFENSVVREADRRGTDGIICGHIHKPELADFKGRLYANCGDWVESCSALVEHADGSLEILRFSGSPQPVPVVTANGDMVFRTDTGNRREKVHAAPFAS